MAPKKEVHVFREEEIVQHNYFKFGPVVWNKDQLYIVDLPLMVLLNN